ncbi:MAG TPA: hypothetical protein VM925_03290 [Labilithrix sp.]|nr:hypothetical protein [Labilithrix sp.]
MPIVLGRRATTHERLEVTERLLGCGVGGATPRTMHVVEELAWTCAGEEADDAGEARLRSHDAGSDIGTFGMAREPNLTHPRELAKSAYHRDRIADALGLVEAAPIARAYARLRRCRAAIERREAAPIERDEVLRVLVVRDRVGKWKRDLHALVAPSDQARNSGWHGEP